MGISRRALTLLGLTGAATGGGGYWYLRTPRTILDPKSESKIEKYSFTLERKSYIKLEWPNNQTARFIYNPNTLEIMEDVIPIVGAASANIYPAGTYKMVVFGDPSKIKAAPVYYFRSKSTKTPPIDVLFDENEKHLYLLENIARAFSRIGGEKGTNDPDELATYIPPSIGGYNKIIEWEEPFRVIKKVLDVVKNDMDEKTRRKYQHVWREFNRYMAAIKTSHSLNSILDGNFYSKIVDKITNIQAINSLNYSIDFASEYVYFGFFAKKASIRGDQATVPVGIKIELDSDLPSIEEDTEIHTNTFNVPAILTQPKGSPVENEFYKLLPKYRQWEIYYEDIRRNILNLVDNSANSL